ncbi:MAG TPA: hypothetical protein DDW52_01140 [Planctomycetaceae bacterium]|nr:hypothetical protein [Planctomycetaceae bacterium]
MDLVLAASVLVVIGGSLFRIGEIAGKRFGAKRPGTIQALAAVGILVPVYVAWNHGSDFRWATLLPHGGVLLLSNSFAVLMIGSGGLLLGANRSSRHFGVQQQPNDGLQDSLRSQVLSWTLCLAASCFLAFVVLRPALYPIDVAKRSNWQDGICIQSHDASCAAAATATLLSHYRITVDEAQMARFCFTSDNGTLALGTFRGLYAASRGHPVKPRAFLSRQASVETLSARLPWLAHVQLDQRESRPPEPISLYGALSEFGPDEGHCVVVLENLPDDRWLVADPAVGKVIWPDSYLRSVWNGEGVYLEKQN